MKKNKKEIALHKLNNLLTNVGLSVELMVRGVYGPLDVKQKKQLKAVLSEAKKMKALLKKI